MWNDEEFRRFVKFVVDNYNADETTVQMAVVNEYDRLMDLTSGKKTEQVRKLVLAETLANCWAWLWDDLTGEDMEASPWRIINHCPAKNFFSLLKRRWKKGE